VSTLWEIMAKVYAEAQRVVDEEEKRMSDALDGKPFWRDDAPAGQITGLADWIPKTPDTDDLDAVLKNLKPPRVTK
jgi:hypothetical protein